MKNMKIGKKLIATFGIIIVMLGIVVATAMYGLNFSGEQFDDFYSYSHPLAMKTLDMRRGMQVAIKSISMSMLTEDEALSETYVQDAQNAMDEVNAGVEYLLETYQGDKTRIEATAAKIEEIKVIRLEIQDLALQNKNDEAIEIFFNEYEPLAEEIQSIIMEMDTTTDVVAEQTYTDAKNMETLLMFAMIAISVVAVIVTLILAIYITRSLTRPIKEIEAVAKEMSDGKLDVEIAYESKDEIGSLATSMRVLCVELKEIIGDISAILGKIADGDFHVKSDCLENYKGDYLPILKSMRLISQNLNATLLQIDESADQVAAGSDQVSSGSQALSQGATEQASSIEELAATITEISQQITDTADNAQGALSETNKSGEEIGVCNSQMHALTGAMQEINDNSQEIGKIIKTIEDIAFQTNILALNAAVEAARAGAAGKGFAVVADEVRNLASKSAEASKNTSMLIESAVTSVEKGMGIAGETAQSLVKVVEVSRNVESAVNKIAAAAQEQANSIKQVTQGVDQISAVIQTNSATAEESAAASEELSGQAEMLKNLVGNFKLRREGEDEAAAE